MSKAHDAGIRAIRDVLEAHRIPYTVVNQVATKNKAGVYRHRGATPGTPDVIACLRPRGRAILIDYKSGKDVVSGAQQLFLDEWEAAGALGVIVYDVAGFAEWLVEKMEAER